MKELDLVDSAFKVKPSLMDSEFHLYMSELIPQFIVFDQEYYDEARYNPAEFLTMEDQEKHQSSIMRISAIQLWVDILIHMTGYKKTVKKYYEDCLSIIENFLQQKVTFYLGVSLFLKVSEVLLNKKDHMKVLKDGIKTMVNWLLPQLIHSPDDNFKFLYINKALNLFMMYKSLLLPENIELSEKLINKLLEPNANSKNL